MTRRFAIAAFSAALALALAGCETFDQLVEAGIDHDFTVRPGRHSWDYWVNSLDYHMMFFAKAFARGEKLMQQ